MLLVECNVLEKVEVINEGKEGNSRLRLRGKFQQCDEQNNNGRIYPRKILEAQVQAIQEKIGDRSLVGALDHPANDAIHLSQASHVITGLSVGKDGSVIGECEILSTPNGKIVEALINDGVKIGISSRGVGSVTEGIKGKIVNEDFKLITFDLVSDPSTRGAFPELSESMRENSERAQAIVSKHKQDRVLLTMLESKISKALKGKQKKLDKNRNGKLDSEDFKILRNESESKVARQAAKMKARSKKIKAKQRGDNTTAAAAEAQEKLLNSTELLGQTVFEAFKKVCWGARKDERSEAAKMKRRIKKAGEEASAKQDPSIEIEATNNPLKKGRYMAAMEKGGLAGARRAATRMQRNAPKPLTAVQSYKYKKGKSPKDDPEGFKKAKAAAQKDSIELFGDVIFETFAGLDQKLRTKRAKRVTKGLSSKVNQEKVTPKIKPGDEGPAADKLDMLGQHTLAAGTRGGAFTDKFPDKPSVRKRLIKHFNRRGAEGEHDTRLAQGQLKLKNNKASQKDSIELFGDIIKERCWKGYEPTPGKKAYSKGSCRPKGGKKKARKDEAKGKFASKRYYKEYEGPFSDKHMPKKGEGPRVDRSTYKKHMRFQAKRQDKLDKD